MGIWRSALAIFALSFLGFAAQIPQDSSNVQLITRLATTLALVEDGGLRIDRFADATLDKALVGGHYYSDKQPGLSLLGVPAAALAELVLGSPESVPDLRFGIILAIVTLSTSCLAGALTAVMIFLIAMRLGQSQAQALVTAAILAFATPFVAWASVFFAHVTSGALLTAQAAVLLFGFAAPQRGVAALRAGLLLGAVSGLLLVVDVVAAPAGLGLGLVGVFLSTRWARRDCLLALAGMAVAGTIAVAPLLIHNAVAFGSPLTLGYAGVVGFEGMKQGFFGIGWPQPEIAAELLFGLYRGLLPLSPLLLLVPVGLFRLWRAGGASRVAAVVIVGVFGAFLWINAGYYYWHGGSSTGPRHLIATLPFLALAAGFGWPTSRAGRVVAIALLGASLAMGMLVAVGGVFAPEHIRNPLEWLIPRLGQWDRWFRLPIIVVIWIGVALLIRQVERRPATA